METLSDTSAASPQSITLPVDITVRSFFSPYTKLNLQSYVSFFFHPFLFLEGMASARKITSVFVLPDNQSAKLELLHLRFFQAAPVQLLSNFMPVVLFCITPAWLFALCACFVQLFPSHFINTVTFFLISKDILMSA